MSRFVSMRLCAALLCAAALPAFAASAPDPELLRLNQRMQGLQASVKTANMAPLQRMQAQQAIDAYAAAKRDDKPGLLYLADRRLDIAVAEVQLEQAQSDLAAQQRVFSQLQVLSSQREVARARQEAEQLRVQAQLQAEETERLRQQAEAEAQAREQAQAALTTVADKQAGKLQAAKQKETQLARQEAELVSGVKVPASKFDDRGEVFTLAGSQFQPGGADLSAAGQRALKGVAAYLVASPKAQATVVGYGDVWEPGQRRAESVRNAMVAAGVPAARIKLAGKLGGSEARMAEVVLTAP